MLLERVRRSVRRRRTGPVAALRRVVHLLRAARGNADVRGALLGELVRALRGPARVRPTGAREAPTGGGSIEPDASSIEIARRAAARRLNPRGLDRAQAGALAALRVALVADPPLAHAVARVTHVVEIRPEDWQPVLERFRPSLLLVTAATHGSEGAWQYRIGAEAHPDAILHKDLAALVMWAGACGIPSVFWEAGETPTVLLDDPALRFDLVATTDPDRAAKVNADPRRRGVGAIIVPSMPIPADPASSEAALTRIAAAAGLLGDGR